MATQGKRRALGQHFLKDSALARSIAEKTIEEARRHHCVGMLEIGPGKGALTLPLLELLQSEAQFKNFVLAEKDFNLASDWRLKFSAIQRDSGMSSPNSIVQFKVREGDFLEMPDILEVQSAPWMVVSNLPYSSGTAILKRLVSFRNEIPGMVLMFQAEVAQRLRAEASTPGRGSLSLWIQNHWDVHKFLEVPPRAFVPPPEVDSEVVILTQRRIPQIEGTSNPELEVLWESLLRICFSQRRKMLRSLLNSRHPWQNALELSQVDGTRRAEALRWPEWNQLFQALREVMINSTPPGSHKL